MATVVVNTRPLHARHKTYSGSAEQIVILGWEGGAWTVRRLKRRLDKANLLKAASRALRESLDSMCTGGSECISRYIADNLLALIGSERWAGGKMRDKERWIQGDGRGIGHKSCTSVLTSCDAVGFRAVRTHNLLM